MEIDFYFSLLMIAYGWFLIEYININIISAVVIWLESFHKTITEAKPSEIYMKMK